MKLLQVTFVSLSCYLSMQAMDSQPVSPTGSQASSAAASFANSPATQELKSLTQESQELTPRTALVVRRIQGLGFQNVQENSPKSNARYQSNAAIGINPNKTEARKRVNEDDCESDGYNGDTEEGSPRKKARTSTGQRRLTFPTQTHTSGAQEKWLTRLSCQENPEKLAQFALNLRNPGFPLLPTDQKITQEAIMMNCDVSEDDDIL